MLTRIDTDKLFTLVRCGVDPAALIDITYSGDPVYRCYALLGEQLFGMCSHVLLTRNEV